jgi:UDP-2,3-diacylglucosamine pyrophosphatase LpxH
MGFRAASVVLVAALAGLLCACAARPPRDAFPIDLPTALPPDRPIAVVGDLQMTSRFVRAVMRREANDAEQEFLLADLQRHADRIGALAITGDLVFTARSASDWRRFDRLIAPIARDVPVLPVIGNHDYHCFLVQKCVQKVVPRNFLSRFPWFSPGQPYFVEYGDLVLVFLDTETELEAQGAWLTARLREWDARYRAALIFMHRPPFTSSAVRGATPDAAVQAEIVPRLGGTRLVPIVIAGHVHGYERLLIDRIHYVTTAGGGGPRGLLEAERPNDVYAGRDCRRDAAGRVQRPFNYLLIDAGANEIEVTVRGFCRGDAAVGVLESFRVPLPDRR